MKILIYGTGVLGSYLAYSLSKANHDITMLARGKRIDELKHGLKIKHVLQRRETLTNVKVVDSLAKTDFYDMVFVVMQANQIESVYQSIIENEACPIIIFVGNNSDPMATYTKIIDNSKIKRDVLFGFLSVGGRRENGKTISLHLKKPNFHLGTVVDGKGENMHEIFNVFFDNLQFSYRWYDNMNGYLKTHITVIMPYAYLAYITNFKLHNLFLKDKYLRSAVLAMKEGFSALKELGVEPVIPKELEPMFRSRINEFFLLRLIIMPPIGRLAICDHCKASKAELDYLNVAMNEWLEKSGIEHPGYDFLIDKLKESRN